mgnify:CR=1 FL=1|jgi:predicted transcriptional regulator
MSVPSSALSLSAHMSRRIAKLADEAGRTPQEMLKLVLRDGVEYCEYVVRSVNEGLSELDTGRTVSPEQLTDRLAKHRATRRAKKAA